MSKYDHVNVPHTLYEFSVCWSDCCGLYSLVKTALVIVISTSLGPQLREDSERMFHTSAKGGTWLSTC